MNEAIVQSVPIKKIENQFCKIIADNQELTEEQWLELRRTGIGGSAAGALMGASKYQSPFTLYMDKVEGVRQDVDNDYIRWGNILEPIVRKEFPNIFAEKTGTEIEVFESPFFYQSIQFPFALGNIDGLVNVENYQTEDGFSVSGMGGLEIKTATVYATDEWKDGQVPDTYWYQVQHYMMVTGLPFFFVVCLLGKSMIWRVVLRDDEAIQMMVEAQTGFIKNHIEPKIPPAPSGLESEDSILSSAYAEVVEDSVEAPELDSEMDEYLDISSKIKALEARKKEIASHVKATMGEHKYCFTGNHKATWSRFTRTSVDSKKLKAEKPEVFAEYSKTSNSGQFRVA